MIQANKVLRTSNAQSRFLVIILTTSIAMSSQASAIPSYMTPTQSSAKSIRDRLSQEALAPVFDHATESELNQSATMKQYSREKNALEHWVRRVGVPMGFLAMSWLFWSNVREEKIPVPQIRTRIDDRELQADLKRAGVFKKPKKIKIKVKRTKVWIDFVDDSFETAREVADVLLRGEERLIKDGDLSSDEKILIALHRQHFDHFARAIYRILLRNPWSLIGRDEKGKIVGIVMCALGYAETAEDLPDKAVDMTHWHEFHVINNLIAKYISG